LIHLSKAGRAGDLGYNKPSTLSSVGAAIGNGKRWNMMKDKDVIPCAYVDHVSEFSKLAKKNSFTFGVSRERCGKIEIDGKRPSKLIIPGPNVYDTGLGAGELSLKFTMGSRSQSHVNAKVNMTPGPADYNIGSEINKNGSFINSKYPGTGVKHFNPITSKRFQGLKEWVPGPNTYAIKTDFSPKGDYFISNYQSHMQGTFCRSKRNSNVLSKSVIGIPGPGSYQYSSEFGNIEV